MASNSTTTNAAVTTRPKGISLHIGLNAVNADAYAGWDGPLAACEFDANDNILYYAAFVDRGTARRIISLRRANRREIKHYVESI